MRNLSVFDFVEGKIYSDGDCDIQYKIERNKILWRSKPNDEVCGHWIEDKILDQTQKFHEVTPTKEITLYRYTYEDYYGVIYISSWISLDHAAFDQKFHTNEIFETETKKVEVKDYDNE